MHTIYIDLFDLNSMGIEKRILKLHWSEENHIIYDLKSSVIVDGLTDIWKWFKTEQVFSFFSSLIFIEFESVCA